MATILVSYEGGSLWVQRATADVFVRWLMDYSKKHVDGDQLKNWLVHAESGFFGDALGMTLLREWVDVGEKNLLLRAFDDFLNETLTEDGEFYEYGRDRVLQDIGMNEILKVKHLFVHPESMTGDTLMYRGGKWVN